MGTRHEAALRIEALQKVLFGPGPRPSAEERDRIWAEIQQLNGLLQAESDAALERVTKQRVVFLDVLRARLKSV